MRIGLATADWSHSLLDSDGQPVWGGSGWVRLGQYHNRLKYPTVAGILVSNGSIFGVRDAAGDNHWDCDVIIMQRLMFGDIADKMPAARASGQILINDLDDWYWGLSQSNSAWLATHPKNNTEENVNHYKRVLSRSDAVHVSTPYLADRIRQWVRCPIHLLHNYIDMSLFTPRSHVTDRPVIGWVGSTSHRSRDLELLRGVLGDFERQGFKFHHSGHHDSAQTFAEAVGVSPENVTTLPLVPYYEYPSVFQFDIGLVPLNDTPFNHAKSYIKGLEYSAAGIPWIASKVGEYPQMGMGRVAKNGAGWRKWIDFYRDPKMRQVDAATNRLACTRHDLSVGIGELEKLLVEYEA